MTQRSSYESRLHSWRARKYHRGCGCCAEITRWSSQFTRWIQDAIVHSWEWDAGVAKLAPLMRAYMR